MKRLSSQAAANPEKWGENARVLSVDNAEEKNGDKFVKEQQWSSHEYKQRIDAMEWRVKII